MKKSTLILIAAALLTTLAACSKTCTCTTWTGTEVEYTTDQLNEMGYNCTTIRAINHGLTYAQCK